MTKTNNENFRPVELDDLFKLKTITEAKFSPDGSQVLYGLSSIIAEEEKSVTNLWLLDVNSGFSRQLTCSASIDSAADWSPDGKKITFRSTRDGVPQVYIIAVDGGEALPLTELKQGAGGGPIWSPDGQWIAFTAGPDKEDCPDLDKPYRVDRKVYRFDGMGYLDGLVQDVYVVPAGGGEHRRLTHDRFNYMNLRWSPDGQEILCLPQADPQNHLPFCSFISVLPLEGEARELLRDWGTILDVNWSTDGQNIIFSGQPAGLLIGSKNDLWVLDKMGGRPCCRTENLEFGVGGGLRHDVPAAWANAPQICTDNERAFVNVQQGGTLQIYEVSLQGEEAFKPLVAGDRAAYLLDLAGGQLLFIGTDIFTPCDLFSVGLDGSQENRLTQINRDFLSGWEQPVLEHLLYKSADDVPVEGWLAMPVGGEPPYPVVMLIHGGPHSAFGYAFNFDFQFLTSAGYAVLFINHRASTGYGNAFATQIKGDWGNLDYQDLISGLDFAIEKGLVDGERVGCTGISGGGNLSCWIIGHTSRFKAAMPENPVTNWNSFYGTSDIGVWFALEELGGHPHEIPEIYTKCSPVTYAHNCTTPTLLVQGENDYRCPAEQSEQFYTILKANGCITEMLRFPNSSHGGAITGALAVRRAHHEALLNWMDSYVLGKTGTEE